MKKFADDEGSDTVLENMEDDVQPEESKQDNAQSLLINELKLKIEELEKDKAAAVLEAQELKSA